jgi:hypothetical protein
MRKWSCTLLSAVLGLAASGAQAGTLGFSGFLAVQIATLAPVAVPGSGVATVGPGSHLSSLALPASPFAGTGIVVPVTDPVAAPIGGVQATVHNGAGSFAGGLGLAGAMPINGVSKVCLFGTCGAAVQNLVVPLTVVGQGGIATVGTSVNITAIGAPWTAGTAVVGTLTAMGFQHGPGSFTSSTAAPSGSLRLVTPIFVSTNIPASAVVPAFGILDLHFVPEPTTALLLAGGVAGLAKWGRSRRV